MNRSIRKIAFGIFGTLCLLIGFYPLLYFIIDRRFGLLSTKSSLLLSDVIWNIGFYGHIVFGGIALAIGWLQFSKKLRQKRLQLHKQIGKVYVFTVLISGISSIYIGYHATGGLISVVGFILLGVVWLYTTISGYYHARKGEINKHELMMIYSYAACFGAVTLRIWLPILIKLFGDFITAYQIVAWLAWVPNIIVAYFITSRKRFSKTKSIA